VALDQVQRLGGATTDQAQEDDLVQSSKG